ncbi:class I adenylate-forming enzyme family protein [Streptomyces mirabilis]|uniref:class I adenylate-forming enzyme family protein n=1 Tax=Streptomyces mirabilis TaxID=68239 RepID=UPI0038016986
MTVVPAPERHVLIAVDVETGAPRHLDITSLHSLVRETAARVRDRVPGLRPGTLLAIALRNSVQSVVLQLAAEELGLVPFPMAPRGDHAAMRDAARASGAVALAHVVLGHAPRVEIEEIEESIGTAVRADKAAGRPGQTSGTFSDWGLAIGTSGSTGSAKTVVLGREALDRNSRAFADRTGLGPLARYVVTAPMWHVGGSVVGMRAAFSSGALLILPPEAKPAVLAAWIERYRPTHLAAVPTVLFDLHNWGAEWSANASWPQQIITGGMAVEKSLVGSLHTLGSRVTVLYGMTEFTNAVMSAQANPGVVLPTGFVGNPFPGVTCRIEPEPSSSGEHEPYGRLLVRGYPRAAAVVQEGTVRPLPVDADGWYETGDLARQTADGYVIVGRSRDVAIRGGVNISGGTLTDAARRTLLAKEAAVQVLPSKRLGEDIALIVHGPSDEECRRRQQDFLAQLPHGTRPGYLIVSRCPLPRTANDKYDLAGMYQQTTALVEAAGAQTSGIPIFSVDKWS